MTERTSRVYIVAEAGVNHNGSLAIAKQLVDVAADAGADAVKFQTFITANELIGQAPKAEYQIQTTGADESQFDMLRKLELDERAHEKLIEHCALRRIVFLSTPFDHESADMLIHRFRLPTVKISSGDLTNAPLLAQIARSGTKIILSTGMSTLSEIEEALSVLAFGYTASNGIPSSHAFREAYCTKEGQQRLRDNVVLLHCTSEYPAAYEDVNLRMMDTLKAAFGLPVGLSDHTIGIAVAIASVARGATLIEKHFTLDSNMPGPDHRASLEPDELMKMVKGIRQVESALGFAVKIPVPAEYNNKDIVRKSIVASHDIRKGEPFSALNVTVKRPGTGLSPMRFWELIGLPASKDYQKDEVIQERC